MESDNIFTGKWRIVGWYKYVPGQGWTEPWLPGSGISVYWDFYDVKDIDPPVGHHIHRGTLHEYSRGFPFTDVDRKTDFAYCPAERRLSIFRYDREPDGFINMFEEKCYRVETGVSGEYWLHLLDRHAASESCDHSSRLRIVRCM